MHPALSLDEDEFHASLGRRLRELRGARGFSLGDLAEQAGVTSSFLSQLENGKKSCSLMTLHRLTAVLNVPLGNLFDPTGVDQSHGPQPVVRRDSRTPLEIPGIRQKLFLLTNDRELSLEPLLNVLPAGISTADHTVSHDGEEWFFVLKGQVELTLDQATYQLAAGDSVGFSSTQPHRVVNHGKEDAELIWVNTPRQF